MVNHLLCIDRHVCLVRMDSHAIYIYFLDHRWNWVQVMSLWSQQAAFSWEMLSLIRNWLPFWGMAKHKLLWVHCHVTESTSCRLAMAAVVNGSRGSFHPFLRCSHVKPSIQFSGRLSLSSTALFSSSFYYHARKRKESPEGFKHCHPQEEDQEVSSPSHEFLNAI